MAEITNELIGEVLRAVQADMAPVKERIAGIDPTQPAMCSHPAGLVTSEFTRESDLAARRARIERIERRLELRERRPLCHAVRARRGHRRRNTRAPLCAWAVGGAPEP